MRNPKQDGWYQRKSIPHFDTPLSFEEAKQLVEDPQRISSHAFWPLIGFTEKKRRFKPDLAKKYVNKERDIKYCAHRDGYIFSYYSHKLSAAYEAILSAKSLTSNVIGYRPRLGTNIDFSKELFDEIRRRKNCLAIAIDIKDFFPSISHVTLKAEIQRVLGVSRLTPDWFAVFRAMTTFSWVEQKCLTALLSTKPKKFKRPICSVAEFRKFRAGFPCFVRINTANHGIPQGSPISAIMSNVAMLSFDERCGKFCLDNDVFYRRYSDDLVFVCNEALGTAVEELVVEELKKHGSAIKISKDKTEMSRFYVNSSGSIECDKPLSYLGFTFDGTRVFLRGKTLSRYYRRMTYAGRAARRAAKAAAKKGGSPKVFKRKLIAQFSHLGKLSFYSYAKRASKKHGDVMPKRQLRKHFKILLERC